MIEIIDILGKIGIGGQEARVYLALLKLQEAQTGQLCNATKIASSHIYNILQSLLQKGLISYKIKNNIRIFMPSNPEALNILFEEKQNKLAEEKKLVADAILNLKKITFEEMPQANYKYYEDISGIKSMWQEMIETATPEAIMKMYTGKKGSYDRLVGFFNEIQETRYKKGVKMRIIFPEEEMKLAKIRSNDLTEVRFMKLENASQWGVWKNVIQMHHYPVLKKPYGFLIKDAAFGMMFEQMYDQLWENAKPYNRE